jgi:hypothetical protein
MGGGGSGGWQRAPLAEAGVGREVGVRVVGAGGPVRGRKELVRGLGSQLANVLVARLGPMNSTNFFIQIEFQPT